MKKLSFLFLLPGVCSAQLIFDYGIGFQGGAFRLSKDREFYEKDELRSPAPFQIDSSEYFYVKPGDGVTFGLTIMAVCTLGTPDARVFYTVSARPTFGYSQFQMYTPRFSLANLVPEEQVWIRDSLRAVQAGVLNLPVLGYLNLNLNNEGNAVYFGAGLSWNMMKLDQRNEFNRVETIVVVEDAYNGPGLESYRAYYKLTSYAKVETQLGFIWNARRGHQQEAYLSASMGKGKQGAVLLGYFWRFNFYNG